MSNSAHSKGNEEQPKHDVPQHSLTVSLPDGRKLGYADFGSRNGTAVLVFHGMAASRLDAANFHDVGLERNARFIGVDRPGMGLSSPHKGRTVLTFAQDVEELTRQLCLEEYGIMGISGGGPPALACAKALPSNLKAVAMIAALGPPDIGMKGAQFMNRLGYPYGFLVCPSFLNRWFWRRQAIGRVDLSDDERLEMWLNEAEQQKSTMPVQDQKAMADVAFLKRGLESTRQGFAQGYDGVLEDGKLCCRDLGFKMEEIRADLPVHLWYGKLDVNVPANHGVQMAQRLSRRQGKKVMLRLEEETHMSLMANWKGQMVEALLEAMTTGA